MSLKNKIRQKLTDAYNKNPDSNMGKLIGILVSEFEELQSVFQRIDNWRSVDKAEGKVLDEIGVDISQYRGTANDEIYRILLKSKTARDLSTGDTNTIIDVLSMAIGADKSEIGITETWMDAENPEPAGIKLIEIPIAKLNEVGMTGNQFAKFVAATVAAGIYVQSIELQGTFEYGGLPSENDSDKGFSNVDMTTGGYYGTVYQPDNEQDLPL